MSKRRGKRSKNTATVRMAEGRQGTVALSYTQSPQHYQQSSTLATTNQPNLNTQGEHPYPAGMVQIPAPATGREPTFDQLGAPGVTIFSGILDQNSIGEYNTDFGWQQGIQIFDMMRRNDGMVKAIELQIKNPILRGTWRIKPGSRAAKDQEIAAFIESCLFHDMSWQTLAGRTMRQTWPEILSHILSMLPYGFSLMEVCWKKEDGWIKWARWTPLMARTVYKWWPDEHNDLVGVQFYTWRDMQKQFIDIPLDKLLYFVHDQEGNNPEGQSIFRAAYKHWWYLDRYYAIEAVAIERTAVAPPVVKLPPNPTPAEEAAARNIVENIRVNEKMGVVLTNTMDIEVLRGTAKQSAQVQPPINHHNYKIALAVLAQFLAMGGMEHGSNARSENELFNFLAAYQVIIEYICAIINQEIRRLVDYNFDGVEAYPELTCSKLVAQDILTLAETWQKLQAGNVPAFPASQPAHQKFFADSLGMPVAVSDPVTQQNPSNPQNPDRPDGARGGDHGDAASQAQMSEARMLAVTLAEVYAADAVERGLAFGGFDPSQHPHIPKGSPGAGQWGMTGGKKTGGKGAAKSGGTAKKKPSSGGSAHLAPKASVSGASKAAGAPKASATQKTAKPKAAPKPKAEPGHTVEVKDGKAVITHAKGNTVVVEADHDLGGYKITVTYPDGASATGMHGVSATGVNSYLHGFTGKTAVFTKVKADVPAGAKKTAAEKKAAYTKMAYDKLVPKDGNVAEIPHGNSIEYHKFQGDKYEVYHNPAGIVVKHTPAYPYNPKTADIMHPWKGNLDHLKETVEIAKNGQEAQDILAKHGITNHFDEAQLGAKPEFAPLPGGWGSDVSTSGSGGSGVSPHSTTGWNQAMHDHMASGTSVAEATPASGIGHYTIKTGNGEITITRNAAGFTIRHGKNVTKSATAAEAKQELDKLGIEAQAHHFVDFAEDDYARYGGKPTAEQQARIDHVNARRAELDQKYGAYSQDHAQSLMNQAYAHYDGLRAALDTHLTGGTHLTKESIAQQAKKMAHHKTTSPEELQDKAAEALEKIHEISEYALLHASSTTREGTVRLFHGTNGKSNEATWSERLKAGGAKRGTPFTDHWSVAHGFADKGKYGPMIISAHVPVENVAAYQHIRGDSMYSHEYEYTVGKGHIDHFAFVHL